MEEPSGLAPRFSVAAQVLVADVSAPELDAETLHHLTRVLRLRRGESVCASDGEGGWTVCEFDGSSGLTSTGLSGREPEPERRLTVGVALMKASKPELVVQKLTELGIDRIVLFEARNSVVKWDSEKVAKQIPRLRKIASAACEQSRRLHLPDVEFSGLAELLSRPVGTGWDNRGSSVLADAGGRPLRNTDSMVLIGPEGGWDPSEGEGIEKISLGPTILRAETAAIAAATQLTALRAGLLTEGQNLT